MNGSPFKGSTIVFQVEDPIHLPCTIIPKKKTFSFILQSSFPPKLENLF
jgi:hypothetical protein